MSNIVKLLCILLLCFSHLAYSSTQTLVFFRHGEKPQNDSGQLSCKGLNRALALPDMLISEFGSPTALFASAPTHKLGSSLRALQTLTPTAIKVSLPIHLDYHATETHALQKALLNNQDSDSVIFIAWEHHHLVEVVREIISEAGQNPAEVPDWSANDFDSVYLLHINRINGVRQVTFEHQYENLNQVSELCY